jgi:cell wall-associated NlpC family hydrolase
MRIQIADLLGVAWVPGGRMVDGRFPLDGIDCWGVVVEVRRRAGLWTPDPWGCGPQPVEIHPDGLPESFLRHLVPLAAPAPYCALKMRSAWAGGHAAVYLPDGSVLQTHRMAGVVRHPYWRVERNVLACYGFTERPAR